MLVFFLLYGCLSVVCVDGGRKLPHWSAVDFVYAKSGGEERIDEVGVFLLKRDTFKNNFGHFEL